MLYGNPRIPYLREKTSKLTSSPGVYLMKNKSRTIIYIGKAKNLKNRVSSYFRENPDHNEKTKKMVSNVYDYDFIVTDTEYEALVLECSLIKQHMPKYNILLKDDKGYHYIKISNEPFPRITSAKKIENDNAKYIGPYTSSFTAKQSVDEANRVFMLPTCNKAFPQQFKKSRPCLNFHIKRCMGLCNGDISKESYNETIKQAVDYITDGSSASVEKLTMEMEAASENLDFEKAIILRNRIAAIKKAGESQKIIDSGLISTDIIAAVVNNQAVSIAVLVYRNGRLCDKSVYFLGDEDDNILESFMVQYYSDKQLIPDNIIVEDNFENIPLVQKLISERAGHKVNISSKSKGNYRKFIMLAKSNAAEYLALKINRTSKEVIALEQLSQLLGLDKTPLYIEAYDISNLSSESMVAGMAVFENGRPLKSAYKKFSIKTVAVQNDYECMREVLSRRFNHYDEKSEDKSGFNRLPDLIFVDGGKGQVSAVEPLLREMGINVPVYGIVKDGKHHTRAIASSGAEISVSSMKSAFTLITNIQDEMHRFAITYQRKRHDKRTFDLELTKVKGIGQKKASKLIMHYKTKNSLKQASAEELASVAGVNMDIAKELYNLIQEL
ncbi:MAG: excinuclease ABC subunit UvrC [Oscillospiraceae bacterium]